MRHSDRTNAALLSEAPVGWSLLAAIAIVASVAMQPYIYGYRLSGDDIWFLTLAVEGRESIIGSALHVAREQGRIGQMLMVPLNVLGAWLVGDPGWRVAFLAIYGLHLLLFAVFVGRLLRCGVAPFLFLLLVTLHPLTFAFMPPNAYPLQNTVPFIVILLARLVILRQRERDVPSRAVVMAAQAAFALGMIVSEFAVAFGTALLIAEYCARMQWARGGAGVVGAICAALAPRRVASDAAAVFAVLLSYGLFRWAFPGTYEGNAAGGLHDPMRIIITVLGHVRDGTAFPRLGGGLGLASAADLAVAAGMGIAVAVILCRVVGPVLRIAAPLGVLATALLLAVYVTLPIAVSAKYQAACVDRGACAYLDSRMSYLAVTVALTGALAFVWQRIGRREARRRAIIAACAALGLMASLVSIYNAGKARDMRHVHEVWLRADALACTGPALDGDALAQAIDPKGFVVVNAPNRVADFWTLYIPWRAESICK